ncbi:VanW family protein (plasmid) [Stanieria cyanosphaera PCC 7437]|uniref:VanW family protein n=1 Tax=Stanieria cyanosphaera (strain ATCC 29371 / PCC 7437) TaxID=111780 RepID=K9Y0H7_STAC7|nr:hypothetical protein [Stanieria cyanosphaera]AFZ38243.1 VanW family protein [Stanieria cyanosphaera PCC 7437]
MTQTKTEKKFFWVKIDKFFSNLASKIDKNPAIANFQVANKIIVKGDEK